MLQSQAYIVLSFALRYILHHYFEVLFHPCLLLVLIFLQDSVDLAAMSMLSVCAPFSPSAVSAWSPNEGARMCLVGRLFFARIGSKAKRRVKTGAVIVAFCAVESAQSV
jgi:hypothetical protein